MAFKLDEAYVDLVLREQAANDKLQQFRSNVGRQTRDAANEGGNNFDTLLFGRMGRGMQGAENMAARAFGGIGKMFLRGGLLGVGIVEGIHVLKDFGEELITGGEHAKQMAERVSELKEKMSELSYETSMAGDAIGDLNDRQQNLLSGKLSGETPLEKLAGKQSTPRIKKEIEDILRLQDKEEEATRKRAEELMGRPGATEEEKQEKYDAQVALRMKRIEKNPLRFKADLNSIPQEQVDENQSKTDTQESWWDRSLNHVLPRSKATREAMIRRRLLAEKMVGGDVGEQQRKVGSVEGSRKTLSDVIEKMPEQAHGRQQLGSVEDFGRRILEMGGGEKAGASEEVQTRMLKQLEDIAKSLNNNPLGDKGGATAQ